MESKAMRVMKTRVRPRQYNQDTSMVHNTYLKKKETKKITGIININKKP